MATCNFQMAGRGQFYHVCSGEEGTICEEHYDCHRDDGVEKGKEQLRRPEQDSSTETRNNLSSGWHAAVELPLLI